MGYTPRWLTASSWEEDGILELDADALSGSDSWPEAVREALGTAQRYGLPREAAMFYPSTHGAPFTVVSDPSGHRYWRLGQHDAQLNPGYHVPEYVLDSDGRVLLLDPSLPKPRFVNSSLIAFLDALAAWDYRCEHVDDFDDLESEEDEDEDDEDEDEDDEDEDEDAMDPSEAARIAFGLEIRDRLRELDPPAFEMDTWWDRVYEEVELDAI
ncbi:SUKH-4 family immunity protein [Streptomyces viridodiastaticus]|uniref:SUKH-4 family immunity protein n=1 Tax=Streptomyces albogriseolus TaxID=1887 RepID=UPI0022563A55|nr:SUKH-4 family immunity protein [Streptomyces viridodiastaticus]MCX4570494.1 SUKH-4 family immunity protein [Streptomyces viridodiastaticus]